MTEREARITAISGRTAKARPSTEFMDHTTRDTPGEGETHPAPSSANVLPESAAAELRRLSHDLSNSLEVIVQTSYLLSLAELKEPAAEWLRMLETGLSKALEQNQSIRAYVREHSPK